MKLEFNFGAMTFVHILIYLEAHRDRLADSLAIEMQIIANDYISGNLWEEIDKLKLPKRTADDLEEMTLDQLSRQYIMDSGKDWTEDDRAAWKETCIVMIALFKDSSSKRLI